MGGTVVEIELEIEGVADRKVAERIRKMVRLLGPDVDRPGGCRIRIAPSETRGEWDLGILAPPSPWDLASFAAPVERLPDLIEQTLRERLALPHQTLG